MTRYEIKCDGGGPIVDHDTPDIPLARTSKPPILFSPRWFRLAWIIVKEGVRYQLSK